MAKAHLTSEGRRHRQRHPATRQKKTQGPARLGAADLRSYVSGGLYRIYVSKIEAAKRGSLTILGKLSPFIKKHQGLYMRKSTKAKFLLRSMEGSAEATVVIE